MPRALWAAPAEWPKLDLPKNRLTRLALAWTVPHSPKAEAEFADLLDFDGSFTGVRSYTRGRVRHYRTEAAQLVPAADVDDLVVTVQNDADTGTLGTFPKFLEEDAWLLESLQAVDLASPVRCAANFAYRGSLTLQTAVPLPLPLDPGEEFSSFDEIRGVRGVKHAIAGDEMLGYSFILDRRDNDDIGLALEYAISPGPVERAPNDALAQAVSFAERIVVAKRK
ncbi:MAG: hypothetical protein ACRDJC_13945 [Thermomicrobiales bacterium]